LTCPAHAAGPAEYTGLEAAKHIGETGTVTDKVETAYQAKGGNIFLNMGGKHPEETFTVFVPASAAPEFKDIKMYDGKTISVTGKIEDHKGKPQISVKSPSDITIKSDASSASSSATSAASSASPTATASP
jgi:DNA/RNA endonuclease YhcR with UshA esterase domain